MNVVAELIGKIRGKRLERFQTSAEQYEEQIGKLARGEQVDVEELATLLDELDKSDTDLESDVANKHRRLEAAARIEELRKVQASLPKLRAESERAQAELSEAIGRLKPIALAAERKLFDAETEAAGIGHEESILMTIGVGDHIKQRQAALQPLIQKLREKREQYEYRTEDKKHLPAAQRWLDDAEKNLAKCDRSELGNYAHAQEQVTKAKAEVARIERILENWKPLADEIAELTSQIEKEQAEIKALLMVP